MSEILSRGEFEAHRGGVGGNPHFARMETTIEALAEALTWAQDWTSFDHELERTEDRVTIRIRALREKGWIADD